MSFFSRFSKKKNHERVLFIDIGSGAVSTAIVSFGDARPHVLGHVEEYVPVTEHSSLAEVQKHMLSALKTALSRTQKLHLASPDRISVCLGAPWYMSQVRKAHMSRPTSFVVNQKMLDDMIAREIQAFESEVVTNTHGTDFQLRQIEARTLAVDVNGYSAHNPIGVSAQEVSMTLYAGVAQESVLEAIENIVFHAYPARAISFSSFLAVAYYVSRICFPHEENALLVDIGGEVTDVSVIRDGVLSQSLTFHMGSNSVMRSLSKALNRSLAESASLWKLSVECKTDGAVAKTCDQTLMKARQEWIRHFHAVLATMLGSAPTAKTIIVSVEKDATAWFTETISKDFAPHTLHVLSAGLLHGSITFDTEVPRDPSLLMEIIGAGYLRRNTSMVQ